ncbi:MAG: MFS transporter, partial [Pseudomonadota bacterium]
MKTAIGALLFVVFLDTMNQGLVIPILNTVIMDPSQGFLPAGTTVAERQVNFGIAMGVFYFAWFLGAAYISNISDSIGRKQGILICLTGNLIGYGLTIYALQTSNFALLVA